VKIFLFILLIFRTSAFPQRETRYACTDGDEGPVRSYFLKIDENKRILSDFYSSVRSQTPRFPLCWHGCAVSLPLPWFPEVARKYGMNGKVTIETISNEEGRIIFAKTVRGPALFKTYAEMAACSSKFRPMFFNGNPIKFRWTIVYNFIR
jgi:hypothetical protein